MGSESASLEERLRSLLAQLKTESGILDRIVYKGKNQHRRCLYFQYLLKVRRDVRLLLSASVEEILSHHFQVINGNKPKQKVYLLERLKQKKHHNGKHNFQERLLGVARLLSQGLFSAALYRRRFNTVNFHCMVEPILKAAIQISSLLARSFFMGFSLTIMALLARFRVLVQQLLLDVVLVFNMVSSISQKEQSVKLTQEEIEVYQEYYPPSGEVLTSECVWEGDKFVLLERISTTEMKVKGRDFEEGRDISLGTSNIQYQCIEVSNEDPCLDYELGCEMVPANCSNEESIGPIDDIKNRTINALCDQSVKISDDVEIQDCAIGNDINDERSPQEDSAAECGKVASICPFLSPKTQSQRRRNNVAFVSVRKFAPSETSDGGPHKKLKADWSGSSNKSEDPFFSLLTAGNTKASLF